MREKNREHTEQRRRCIPITIKTTIDYLSAAAFIDLSNAGMMHNVHLYHETKHQEMRVSINAIDKSPIHREWRIPLRAINYIISVWYARARCTPFTLTQSAFNSLLLHEHRLYGVQVRVTYLKWNALYSASFVFSHFTAAFFTHRLAFVEIGHSQFQWYTPDAMHTKRHTHKHWHTHIS